MKIEISVQEYFNELKLMEKHYGQEEDLYPWIYMLLQMAECKKKEILKDWYEEVSIRDVHNDSRANKENTIREIIVKKGVPDFLVVDMGTEKFLGCVEIKQFVKERNLQSLNISERGECKIIIDSSMKFKYRVIGPEEKVNSILKEISNKVESQEQDKKWEIKNTYPGQQENKGNMVLPIYSQEKIEELDQIMGELKEKIQIKREPISMTTDKDEEWESASEIASHLKQYKKLIYTNGLEFYYLELKNEKEVNDGNGKQEITVDVTELANLTNSYENYKSGKANASTILEAAAEWDKLIAGLTKINWLAKPTTLISEDSK